MGRLFVVSLEGKIYSCKHCRTHLALSEDIVSKNYLRNLFQQRSSRRWSLFVQNNPVGALLTIFLLVSFHCRHGKAYLFNKVVNVSVGVHEDRLMTTGMHTVADIFCVGCGSIVGWRYETAHEKTQKYKEGKSVLERYKISGPDGSNYWITSEAHVGGSDADDA